MAYRLLADLVVLLHFAFILFVLFGGLLLLRAPRLAWLHLPAVAWGTAIELTGRICPLTPLENHFRALAGQLPYREGFIERYLVPLVYPAALSRSDQYLLAAGCLLVNGLVYFALFTTWRRRSKNG
ncbi:MAG: DUF2784 domain-containing protein [Thermodesulfobacteriota bacterium]